MQTVLCVCLLITLVNILSAQVISEYVKVKTSEGTVIGSVEGDGNYYTFYGIPYAGPTSGENRFKEPSPPSDYEELIANNTNILCAQPSPSGLVGIEDCLTLNIFTKSVQSIKPVIVWLNGEDFSYTDNTKNYSYKTFINFDLVFIEVNYRLSIFGFLCLGVEEAPGNAGLKDVKKALEWIHKNIKDFGGDPDNVLLLGHGSGAAMVDLLTISSESKGLVHKAVALSGSAFSPWAISYEPIRNAQNLAVQLGLHEIDNAALAEALKNIDSEKIVKEINTFQFPNQASLFAPCVENPDLDGNFLSDAPINLLRSKSYNDVPYIGGFVVDEGTVKIKEAMDSKWLDAMQKNFSEFLPAYLTFTDEASKVNISEYVRSLYFGDQLIGNDTIEDFFEYEGDILIKYPMLMSVKERVVTSNTPIRFFIFAYKVNEDDIWTYGDVTITGVRHGGILDYIFDGKNSKINNPETKLINHIVDFAKTGIPHDGDPSWHPISNTFNYLVMMGDESHQTKSNVRQEVRTKAPWSDIISSYYRTPIPVSYISSSNSLIASEKGMPPTILILIIICVLVTVSGGVCYISRGRLSKVYRPARDRMRNQWLNLLS